MGLFELTVSGFNICSFSLTESYKCQQKNVKTIMTLCAKNCPVLSKGISKSSLRKGKGRKDLKRLSQLSFIQRTAALNFTLICDDTDVVAKAIMLKTRGLWACRQVLMNH